MVVFHAQYQWNGKLFQTECTHRQWGFFANCSHCTVKCTTLMQMSSIHLNRCLPVLDQSNVDRKCFKEIKHLHQILGAFPILYLRNVFLLMPANLRWFHSHFHYAPLALWTFHSTRSMINMLAWHDFLEIFRSEIDSFWKWLWMDSIEAWVVVVLMPDIKMCTPIPPSAFL